MCGGTDAGGGAELHNMQSPIRNASEYTEELWRCIGDVLEKCGVRYTGLYSDTFPQENEGNPSTPLPRYSASNPTFLKGWMSRVNQPEGLWHQYTHSSPKAA